MPIMYARNTTGIVELQADDDGQLKLAPNILDEYKLSDIDDAVGNSYFGYVDKDGRWYIMNLTASAARYCKGDDHYSDNWDGRAGLDYDYFYNVF